MSLSVRRVVTGHDRNGRAVVMMLVQRGTIHNWVNRGVAPCIIAFVLVAARPATAGGRTLEARG